MISQTLPHILRGTSSALAHVVVKHQPGQVISGTLRLLKRIAEGGMGSIWVAEHLVLGREVAVKLMSPQWAAMPNARTRFLREARMTAGIDSPHVVRVLDCRLDEADEPYLVLELLHGENLEQRISRHGVLSVWEVEEIVSQTCEALASAHDSGIVHRDIKPENVFLVAGARTFVKLLDFGVSKPMRIEDCLDVDRLPAGTPQYMSPEHMFEPETTDERSDLFSLGAVAYFALTRRCPFEAASLEAVYLAIEGNTFKRPSELRRELPASLDAWFDKALARDRSQRFQSAREMAAELRAAAYASMHIEAPASAAPVDATDGEALSAVLPSMSKVLGSPRRSLGRMLGLAFATAATTFVLAWKSDGDVRTAIASTTTDTAEGGATALAGIPSPMGSPAAQPASPSSAAAACETAPDPEHVTTAIQEIIGSIPNPKGSP